MAVTHTRFFFDFYIISYKADIKGAINYGRNTYDFEEGTMLFSAPGQVFTVTSEPVIDLNGWTLFVHPTLLHATSLHQDIQRYNFFAYAVNEALYVSAKEKVVLTELVNNIKNEIAQNIDRHSQELIIHNLATLLKYSERFYDRQFLTRSIGNKDFVSQFEQFIQDYINAEKLASKGMPTIEQCGQALHMSGHYLSDLLKVETGKTIKEHIHLKIIDKAKNQLLNSQIPVKSIAYDLGFESPQYFSRLFKSKTGVSPTAYRNLN